MRLPVRTRLCWTRGHRWPAYERYEPRKTHRTAWPRHAGSARVRTRRAMGGDGGADRERLEPLCRDAARAAIATEGSVRSSHPLDSLTSGTGQRAWERSRENFIATHRRSAESGLFAGGLYGMHTAPRTSHVVDRQPCPHPRSSVPPSSVSFVPLHFRHGPPRLWERLRDARPLGRGPVVGPVGPGPDSIANDVNAGPAMRAPRPMPRRHRTRRSRRAC